MEERLCFPHKWKIVRVEEGQKETFMTFMFGFRGEDIMIYHLVCEKCGEMKSEVLPLVRRNEPYRIWKKEKWLN